MNTHYDFVFLKDQVYDMNLVYRWRKPNRSLHATSQVSR